MMCQSLVNTARHLRVLTRLNKMLSLRCISHSPLLYSSAPEKTSIKTLEKAQPSDRRVILFKRNNNHWTLFRVGVVSMWIIGIPMALNFLGFGWELKVPKFMLGTFVFFAAGWYAAAFIVLRRQVRHLEYSPAHKRLYFTTIGVMGRPVVVGFRLGEVLYNDSVKETERVYFKILNKEYILQLNKGTLYNEDLLWKLTARKDFDDLPWELKQQQKQR